MHLYYGQREIHIPLDSKHLIKVLNAKKQIPLRYPEARLKKLLEHPINSLSLSQLLEKKQSKKVLVIVNDITRPTPYNLILSSLLEALHQSGIKKSKFVLSLPPESLCPITLPVSPEEENPSFPVSVAGRPSRPIMPIWFTPMPGPGT